MIPVIEAWCPKLGSSKASRGNLKTRVKSHLKAYLTSRGVSLAALEFDPLHDAKKLVIMLAFACRQLGNKKESGLDTDILDADDTTLAGLATVQDWVLCESPQPLRFPNAQRRWLTRRVFSHCSVLPNASR